MKGNKFLFKLLTVLLFLTGILFLISKVIYLAQIVPDEIAKNTTGWPMANYDYANTRAYKFPGIHSSNISSLGLSWSLPITGVSEWGAATTNPLILGNTVYLQDLKSNIYSVDLSSGKLNWRKDVNMDIAGPNGLSVGWGKIFAQKGHYDLMALDMKGRELWTQKLSTNPNVGIDVQPSAYDHLIYTSTVPGVNNQTFYRGGSVGTIYALNEATGRVKWSFDTIDSKDIWGNAQVNSGGGAWYPPAIDLANKIMYWGIGNPAPWPGTKDFPNGTSRPGPNLYTNSIVALDHLTGSLKWYNQVAPHDLFDYDFQASPILTNLTIAGKATDVVIGAGKMGKVVAMDRNTGKTLWTTPVGVHLNDNLKTLPPGITSVSPSPLGGVETMMAYANGIVFVPVVDMTVQYTPTGFVATSFNLAAGKGELVAINAATGKVVWVNKFGSMNVGAATVVNDLVFTSTLDGNIYAFDAKSGKKMWQYQAPAGINGWPAVSEDTIIFPAGMGKNPVLLAFKVGASGSTAAPEKTSAPAAGKGFQQ